MADVDRRRGPQAPRKLTFTGAEAQAVLDILGELSGMDASGLPKDASMSTAAGPLSVRALNRARWVYQRLPF